MKTRDDFRFDIQGLRAIAILAVLIFHIDPTKLPGGYIGVDLFFVISGFLITGHLCRDLDAGTFRFHHFYLKRIRRLYPALFAMLIATAIGVYLFYLPQDAKSFGASLMATSVYASNIFFYTQAGYFDDKLHNNPLLHTWSLSVEEQFYIVFPLVLFLLYKFAKARLLIWIAIIGAISFAISEAVLRVDPTAAFFFSPTRFGQFFAGSLVAIAAAPNLSKTVRELLSWAGLGMIAGSIILFSKDTPFPGIASLLPTAGAALVLYAGQKQDLFASRLLSLPPAQFFGRISYSLYLWHWPIILFYKYYFFSEILKFEKLTVGAVCIVAGYLSYRFIEVPGLRLDYKSPAFLKGAIAVGIAGLAIGGAFVGTNGFTQRFNQEELKISSYLNYDSVNLDENCFLTQDNQKLENFNSKKCLAFSNSKPNILLFGDSHAAHYYSALRDIFPKTQISQLTSSGCRPLLGTKGEEYCLAFREKSFREFIPLHKYDAIIVAGRWRKEEAGSVEKTISALSPHAKKIIVIGPVMEYSGSLPRLMAISLYRHDGGKLIEDSRKYKKIAQSDKAMQEAVSKTTAEYFSVLEALCDDRTCQIETDDHVPFHFDYGHMTHEGATVILQQMKGRYFSGLN